MNRVKALIRRMPDATKEQAKAMLIVCAFSALILLMVGA
tara:strand:- start:352 stop:468 length:117 start_codon:yes stop_codon:yes gene_type:complete